MRRIAGISAALLCVVIGACGENHQREKQQAMAQCRFCQARRDVRNIYPPWRGEFNPAPQTEAVLRAPLADNAPDFYGDPSDARLVLYATGEYYYVLAQLVRDFVDRHEEYRGKVFYETLPPVLLAKQMENGGRLTVGNLTLTAPPDVFHAGDERITSMSRQGKLGGRKLRLFRDRLAIILPPQNPANITCVRSLAESGVCVAVPDPQWCDMAERVRAMLRQVADEVTEHQVYERKVLLAETVLARVHHREIPLLIMTRGADAGVMWRGEILYQRMIGNPVAMLEIEEAEDPWVTFSAGRVAKPPHPEAADAWMAYLDSKEARDIIAGFNLPAPYRGPEPPRDNDDEEGDSQDEHNAE